MRVCPSCQNRFESEDWKCPDCGFEPERIQGHTAFAPEMAVDNDGYNSDYFSQIDGDIEESFWFRARKELFIWAIGRYFPRARNFLEIGCGEGVMLSFVGRAFPGLDISGSEIFTEGLNNIPNRIPGATAFQADACRLPFENEFDIIGAFDVIEHIEDHQRVLDQMFQSTTPGGGILISVPHHPFMWSQRDEYVRHKRRYTNGELARIIREAGFEIVRMTAFISIPFPAMVIESLLNRKPKEDYNPLTGLRMPGFANRLLSGILGVERQIIKAGVSFPFGGSLMAVARKPL